MPTLWWSQSEHKKTSFMCHQIDNKLHAHLSSSHVLTIVIYHDLVILLCLSLGARPVLQRPPWIGRAAAQPPYWWQRDVEQGKPISGEHEKPGYKMIEM